MFESYLKGIVRGTLRIHYHETATFPNTAGYISCLRQLGMLRKPRFFTVTAYCTLLTVDGRLELAIYTVLPNGVALDITRVLPAKRLPRLNPAITDELDPTRVIGFYLGATKDAKHPYNATFLFKPLPKGSLPPPFTFKPKTKADKLAFDQREQVFKRLEETTNFFKTF